MNTPNLNPVTHVAFYGHGLTPIGHVHNSNMHDLMQPMLGPNIAFHPLTSLSSYFIIYGMYNLAMGVDHCSDLLVAEIDEAMKLYPDADRVSFVGASMGGINFRHVIWKLKQRSDCMSEDPVWQFGGTSYNSEEDMHYVHARKITLTPLREHELRLNYERVIKMHAYISIGVPHLGAVSSKFWAGEGTFDYLSTKLQVVNDLKYDPDPNSFMSKLADEEHVEAMKLFVYRVNFIPEHDDGIVHPASCTMTYGLESDDIHNITMKPHPLRDLKWEMILILGSDHEEITRLWPGWHDKFRAHVGKTMATFIKGY